MKIKLFKKSKSKKNKNNSSRFRNKSSRRKLKLKQSFKVRTKTINKKKQKGGLGRNDGSDIGIFDTWSFIPHPEFDFSTAFKEYIFGSKSHAQKWISLLELCESKGIPVYIVTSGNRIGIIRTLQLLGLSQTIKEVLSINYKPLDPPINPNPRFPGMTNKAQVIQEIMKENGIPCVSPSGSSSKYVGAFVDDDYGNFTDVCPSIQTFYAKVPYKPQDAIRKDHPFCHFFKERHQYFDDHALGRNYVPAQILDSLYKKIQTNEDFRMLILDYDGTLSVWYGAIHFERPNYNNIDPFIVKTPIREQVGEQEEKREE